MPAAPPATTRLTPAGLAAVIVTLLLVTAGLTLARPHLLVAGLAAAAFLIACRHAAHHHLAGISVERTLPRRATAGESFPMELRLETGRHFPGDGVILFSDALAPALKGKALEPKDGSLRLDCTGIAHQRGLVTARSWSVVSHWPLGLFASERGGLAAQAHPLLVRPPSWLPPRLRQELDRRAALHRVRQFETADPLAEFRLLREFRAGDSVRSIHWPSSLRNGHLQVVETEPPVPRPHRYGLILHSLETPGEVVIPEHFEVVLRIASGLLRRFRDEGAPVVFCQAPGSPRLLRERRDFEEALDQIALARRQAHRSLASLCDPVRADPGLFTRCEEVFVIGDSDLKSWESTARAHLPEATCLDAITVNLRRRAVLRSATTPR